MSKKKIITHDGHFHSDDIFAVATLLLILDDAKVIRTRDEDVISKGDFVVDVGGIYDPEKNLFDHHQKGGAGLRENGIPYASFGLVWNKFGEKLCGFLEAADIVDDKLVQPTDAGDNGVNTYIHLNGIHPYTVSKFFTSMVPTWKEEQDFDGAFFKTLDVAKEILKREILIAQSLIEATGLIRDIYDKTKDKRIIILDENIPASGFLRSQPEPIFIVKPRKGEGAWQVVGISKQEDTDHFSGRKKELPEQWAGKRGKELQMVTGVSDAIFCHTGRFMCVTGSKEGAIKLAKIALES